MQNFDCLSKDLPLEGTFFIEASAGTGKTFAIEHITTRLLLKGASLSEILIVTFTKAATRDLKKRIHNNLSSTLNLLQSRDINAFPEYLREIKDFKLAILQIENALALMEEMSVYTIHSFCYQMLSTFAFEALVDFEAGDPESSEHIQLVTLQVLDTLRSLSDHKLICPASLQKLMDLHGRDLSKFVKRVVQFLSQTPKIKDYPTFEESSNQIHSLLENVSEKTLFAELEKASLYYKGLSNRAKEIHPHFYDQLSNLLKGNLSPLIRSSETLFDKLSQENLRTKYVEKKPSELDLSDLLPKLCKEIELLKNPSITFLQIAKLAQKRIEKAHLKGPDYLLSMMLDRLDIEEFTRAVQSHYQALIVDEFQDTDPLQWQIFHKLFYNKVSLLAVVGDPKQSIYSFRGADIQTFFDAKPKFDKHYALTTNYRSNPKVIEILGHLFREETAPGWLSFNSEKSGIAYEEITAGKASSINSDIPPVAIYLTEGKRGVRGRWPTTEVEESQIFPSIAHELLSLHRDYGISFSQMALLIKDRYQAKRLATFLERYQIPLIANVSMSLTETDAFSFLQAAILATLHPRDLSAVKRALAHPFVGWPFEALSIDPSSPEFEKIISLFHELKICLEESGTPTFLNKLLRAPFHEEPLLEQICKSDESISDLNQILPLLFETKPLHLLEKLADLKQKDADEFPLLKRRPLKDGAAVTMITSHLSKGLEFDYVFIPGLGYRSRAKHETIKKKSGYHELFDLSELDTLEALQKLDQEKMRLLYVALTRAKCSLKIWYPFDTSEKPLPYGSASPLELLFTRIGREFLPYKKLYEEIPLLQKESLITQLSQLGISVIEPKNITLTPLQKNLDVTLIPPTPIEIPEKKTFFLSFSQIAKPHIASAPLPQDPSIMPAGPATGNRVHLILEKLIESGSYYGWNAPIIRNLVSEELYGTHLENWIEEVYEMIYAAFHYPIDTFILRDVPPEQMIQESAFLYKLSENALMKGFADLIFYAEGKYYILDWKINRLASYDEGSLHEAMLKHDYYTQAKIYQKALRLHLEPELTLPFEEVFGGTLYAFLRGKERGWLHFFHPPSIV